MQAAAQISDFQNREAWSPGAHINHSAVIYTMDLLTLEREYLQKGFTAVAGVDEVGRGHTKTRCLQNVDLVDRLRVHFANRISARRPFDLFRKQFAFFCRIHRKTFVKNFWDGKARS